MVSQEKPEGYEEAPQWQKDAWDSETNQNTLKLVESGGWCAPSHAEVFGYSDALELPKIQVKRGGIRYPRFRVELLVHPMRKRFLRRRQWRLSIRWTEMDGRFQHHHMEFSSEPLARNAEQIMKFALQTINEEYWNERDTSR